MKSPRSVLTALLLVGGLTLGGALTGCTGGPKTASAPSGVPTAVAVVPGDVDNLVKNQGKNWSFTVTVADEASQKDAVTALKDAGFRVLGEKTANGSTTTSLTNDSYNVTVVATERDGKPIVVYNIVKAD